MASASSPSGASISYRFTDPKAAFANTLALLRGLGQKEGLRNRLIPDIDDGKPSVGSYGLARAAVCLEMPMSSVLDIFTRTAATIWPFQGVDDWAGGESYGAPYQILGHV